MNNTPAKNWPKTDDYSDIIKMPHHVSKRHPKMSMLGRAAQFAPFAALSGFNEAIREKIRLNKDRK